MTPLEAAANLAATVSILLAGRNSVHTWWTGIIGCVLFAILFYTTQLYADVTLQIVFIATSVAGWRLWARGSSGVPLPIRHAPLPDLGWMAVVGLVVTLGYGAVLHRFTDAYAPFVDSAVLVLSLIAQLLLVRRRIETWLVWLAVDTIAVPLYASRGLYLTAALYAAYWVNALYGYWRWRREMAAC